MLKIRLLPKKPHRHIILLTIVMFILLNTYKAINRIIINDEIMLSYNIEKSLQNGDIIQSKNKTYNLYRMEQFLINCNNKQKGKLRIVTYSEDNPKTPQLIRELTFDGKHMKYIHYETKYLNYKFKKAYIENITCINPKNENDSFITYMCENVRGNDIPIILNK